MIVRASSSAVADGALGEALRGVTFDLLEHLVEQRRLVGVVVIRARRV